jgi:hypothetical protein
VFFLLSPNPGALTAATWSPIFSLNKETAMVFLYFLFDGLECVGHSFAYVAHFLFLIDVWIRAAAASSRATNLHTHPSTMVLCQKVTRSGN